jgi:3-hydroxyacyl-CoA dehydrogenase
MPTTIAVVGAGLMGSGIAQVFRHQINHIVAITAVIIGQKCAAVLVPVDPLQRDIKQLVVQHPLKAAIWLYRDQNV